MSGANVFEMPIDYIANGDGTGRPVYADASSRVRVVFDKEYIPNEAEMLRTGKEVLKENILIRKFVRGDTNAPAARATEDDKRYYKKEWEAFLRKESQDGTQPVSNLYGIRSKQVAHLAYLNIYTIQDLDRVPLEVIQEVDEAERLKSLARVWVEARSSEEESASALVVAETYKQRSAELEEENRKLQVLLEEERAKPKARSRRKKGDDTRVQKGKAEA